MGSVGREGRPWASRRMMSLAGMVGSEDVVAVVVVVVVGMGCECEWDCGWVAEWRVWRSLVELVEVLDAGRRERWDEKRLRRTEDVLALVRAG